MLFVTRYIYIVMIWYYKCSNYLFKILSIIAILILDKTKKVHVVEAEPTDINFELYNNEDESVITSLLTKHIKKVNHTIDNDTNALNNDTTINNDHTATTPNSSNVTESMISPQHYVKLLPTLPSTATLAQFLYCYLRDKSKNEIAAIEIAYNILHAIKKNAHFSECSLFQSVLEETLPQDIWYDKMITIERLRVRYTIVI